MAINKPCRTCGRLITFSYEQGWWCDYKTNVRHEEPELNAEPTLLSGTVSVEEFDKIDIDSGASTIYRSEKHDNLPDSHRGFLLAPYHKKYNLKPVPRIYNNEVLEMDEGFDICLHPFFDILDKSVILFLVQRSINNAFYGKMDRISMNTSYLSETYQTATCKCGYTWQTRSKMLYVTCPNDRKMVRMRIE